MPPASENPVAESTERMLQIGEVAERVGLSLRTVRFYEEVGLLMPAARTEGGFRLYTEEQIERLLLIKQMKPLGFSVEQMRELLTAHDTLQDPDADERTLSTASDQVRTFAALAEERCQDLRAQLSRAEEFAAQLRRATRTRPRRS